ncbi:hypothetical protein PQX77_001363 [Marasmius sp. AFHP31]|nr:hypothetical protein PQX77_001363 [Marasmius sp. AFHP31]
MKNNGFHIEHPIPGIIPVPCVSDMPCHYRQTLVEDPLSIPNSPMSLWIFYKFSLWFRLDSNNTTLLSALTRRPVCTTNSFNHLQEAWMSIRDSKGPEVAAIAWGSRRVLVAKIEEMTGYFFLDSNIFTAHFVDMVPLPSTMELGLLSGDFWLR